jgi:hypothetical protein
MKLMVLTSLMIFAPLVVTAQEPGERSGNGPPASPVIGTDKAAPDGAASKVDEQVPPPAQPPAAVPTARRRRGSMVGYIDDAIIESKVRLRFDTGFHNTVPDRAEFFYAKCGCFKDAGADPDAPGPRPGSAADLNFQQFYISGEYAVNDRFSAFGLAPIRWIQPQSFIPGTIPGNGPGFPDQSGIGDLRAGVKVGVAASADQSVTAQAQVYFPTGDAGKGLGTNHASIEPALLYYQRVSDVVALESQVGVWFPLGGSSAFPGDDHGNYSGNILYYGIGPSFEVYKGDQVQVAPVIELVGWRVLRGFQTVPGSPVSAPAADGTNIVNLKVGARFSINRGSFYFGYGHALTDATWYDDIVRFEYRYSF